MSGTIKAIETEYNGYRFRSRLEARWAVFFDNGHIKYEYEPEGYKTKSGLKYLPDFYLPEFDTHVEVKRDTPEGIRELLEKCEKVIEWGGPIKTILVLSDVPEGKSLDGGLWHFPCLYYRSDDDCSAWTWWFFYDNGEEVVGNTSKTRYLPPRFKNGCPVYPETTSLQAVSDVELMKKSRIKPFCTNKREMALKESIALQEDANKNTFNAFKVARQARFEHGETPKV